MGKALFLLFVFAGAVVVFGNYFPSAHVVDGGFDKKQSRSYAITNISIWGKRGKEEDWDFEKPRSVAVSGDGTVYVLDISGRIQRFDRSNAFLGGYPIPGVSSGNPQAIASGKSGSVLVTDTHNNRIQRLETDGTFLPVIASSASAPDSAKPGELFWPCAAIESLDGSIYTLEYGGHDRVQKWTSGGEWIASWGRFGAGEGEFRRPSGLAVGKDGEVYVADSVNNRIQVFTADGKWIRAWDASASPHGRLACPFDVAVLPDGLVAVLEYAASRLRVFSTDGEELLSWGGPSRKNEGLLYPWGMGSDMEGVIYIADTLNHRIVKITLNNQ